MRLNGLILILLFFVAIAGCVPRGHPHRLDLLEVKANGGKVCFGNNEFKENFNKYSRVYISVSKRSLATNQFVSVMSAEFNSKDILLNECFAPFGTDLFETHTEYSAFVGYSGDNNSRWLFTGEFCLPNPKNAPLEVFQLSFRHDVKQVCNIPSL